MTTNSTTSNCIIYLFITYFFSVNVEACVYKHTAHDGGVYYSDIPKEGYRPIKRKGENCQYSSVKDYEHKKSEATKKRARTRKIQQLLYTLGFDPGPIDGDLGKNTIQALKYFQKENKLQIDGKISNDLISNINEKIAYNNNTDKNNAVNMIGHYINPKSLYLGTKLHKNDFEKNEEFESRVEKEIKKKTEGDIFISDVTNSLKEIKYDANSEVWEFKLASNLYNKPYVTFNQIKYVKTEFEKYSNLFGVNVDGIKSRGNNYGSFIKLNKNASNINLLKSFYTGMTMPMNIQQAKSYGSNPPFKFLIAFRFIKNDYTKFHLEVTDRFSPTIKNPFDLKVNNYYIRIHAIAFIVIDQDNKILSFRELNGL